MLWTILVILVVLWLLGIVTSYTLGGFTYTKTTHDAKIGPLELSVKDQERDNVPAWAGVAAIVAGGILLVAGKKA